MKKIAVVLFIWLFANSSFAQTAVDSSLMGKVTVSEDSRIELLGTKLADYNAYVINYLKASKGFRLMVLSTNDRNQAMQLRSKLLQEFPEQKVYMSYQIPFIKIKFGNFSDKEDADKYRKLIMGRKLVTGNIYILPETIEVKQENNSDN